MYAVPTKTHASSWRAELPHRRRGGGWSIPLKPWRPISILRNSMLGSSSHPANDPRKRTACFTEYMHPGWGLAFSPPPLLPAPYPVPPCLARLLAPLRSYSSTSRLAKFQKGIFCPASRLHHEVAGGEKGRKKTTATRATGRSRKEEADGLA